MIVMQALDSCITLPDASLVRNRIDDVMCQAWPPAHVHIQLQDSLQDLQTVIQIQPSFEGKTTALQSSSSPLIHIMNISSIFCHKNAKLCHLNSLLAHIDEQHHFHHQRLDVEYPGRNPMLTLVNLHCLENRHIEEEFHGIYQTVH